MTKQSLAVALLALAKGKGKGKKGASPDIPKKIAEGGRATLPPKVNLVKDGQNSEPR